MIKNIQELEESILDCLTSYDINLNLASKLWDDK